MGNYIDADDVKERMGSNSYNSLLKDVAVDEKLNVINNIIARAESVIDGYIARAWETPVPANDLVTEWAFRIVEFEMYKKALGNDIPVKYKNSYDEILKELKDAGKVVIIIPGATRKTHGTSLDVKSERALFTKKRFYGRSSYYI